MRSGTSGLIGLVLLSAACGGTNPSADTPSAAAAPSKTGTASCHRSRPGVGPTRLGEAREGSTVALVQEGTTTLAYVADADDGLLHTFDVQTGAERAVTGLDGSPSQLLVLHDGRVAVTLRDKNRVQILEPGASVDSPLEPLCTVAVAAEPVALAGTPDDKSIVVTSAWGKRLTSIDAASMTVAFEVPIAREPRAVVVDDDGQRAFVAHVVGAKMSVVDLTTQKHDVREIDLRAKAVERGSQQKIRNGCQGFALAKFVASEDGEASVIKAKSVVAEDDGASPGKAAVLAEKPLIKGQMPKAPPAPKGRVFAPMVTVDPGEVSIRSSGYGGTVAMTPAEAPIVSVVDGAAERALTTSMLADGARHVDECLLPRAAATSPNGSSLFVTCLGIDALLELDARGIDPMRLEKRRWSVPSGPTGVAIDAAGKRAVVWSQFDRELAIVSLDVDPAKVAKPAMTASAKGGAARMPGVVLVAASRKAKSEITPEIAWGRKLFHQIDDDRISRDGRACASCHPDGREDALTWSTPDGPRQTIMLAGRSTATAPFGWNGSHETVKVHLKETFRRLGGAGLPDHPERFDELDALVSYLSAMRGPELAGARIDPDRAKLVSHGKELFFQEAQGCASCHVGGAGTDSSKHDVGSTAQFDSRGGFDTPALRFVSGTAPYFHDGRYSSLEALLLGADGKMGHTLQLSRQDVTALTAYLETL
jgi:DNA-binding beta-propeller fold protein YncE